MSSHLLAIDSHVRTLSQRVHDRCGPLDDFARRDAFGEGLGKEIDSHFRCANRPRRLLLDDPFVLGNFLFDLRLLMIKM
jgi:hypothetical protein